MVHALQLARSQLKPDGLLLNVHDLPVPHAVEVRTAGIAIKAGWLLDSVDFRDERAALNALAQVVAEGSFLLEDEKDFVFNVHMDDLPEFQKWLADGWESAFLPDATIERVNDIVEQVSQQAKIVLKVPARMTRLRVAGCHD